MLYGFKQIFTMHVGAICTKQLTVWRQLMEGQGPQN